MSDPLHLPHDASDFVPWFFKTALGREAVKQAEGERDRRRREAQATIVAVEKERDTEIPKLMRERDKANQEAEKAYWKWQTARQNAIRATVLMSSSLAVFEQRIGEQRLQLRRLANNDLIDAFVDDMQKLHAGCDGLIHSSHGRETTNLLTLERTAEHYSNYPAVQTRARAILAAIQEAQALREQFVEDLPGRLAGLKAAIPSVD